MPRQPSFAGGELAPSLYGRTDSPRYGSALRTMLNFWATPQGAAQNRPGFQWLAEVKDSTQKTRIVPFIVSASEAYVLEFGNLYCRVIIGSSTGEVVTPFTTAMLPYLKFAQSGDVLTICYGGQAAGVAAIAPQDLRRTALNTFTLTATKTAPPTATVNNIYMTGNTGLLASGGTGVPDATHPAKPWNIVFTLSVKDLATGQVRETSIVQRFTDTSIFTDSGSTVPLAVAWSNTFTYEAGHIVVSNGQLWTSLQGTNLNHQPGVSGSEAWWVAGISVYTDRPIYFTLQNILVNKGTLVTGSLVVAVNTYAGKNEVYGLINTFLVNGTNAYLFSWDGSSPDFSQQPPTTTDVFATYDATGAVTGHDYPAIVSYFQQRRIFARFSANPHRILGSRTGQFANFDKTVIVQQNDAVDFTLASLVRDEIRSIVPIRRTMLAFSQGNEWSVGGFNGSALTPTSIDAGPHASMGSGWTDPAKAGNALLYAQDQGQSLHDLVYDPLRDVYDATDISFHASHLLEGHDVVRICYARTPNKIAWVLRDDGVLLGLTYYREGQNLVAGWHRHTTDGIVEDVCVVPDGGAYGESPQQHALYAIVNRTIGGATHRYIERLAQRRIPNTVATDGRIFDIRLSTFLDCSSIVDGRLGLGGATLTVTGGTTWAPGDAVTATISVAVSTVGVVGNVIVIDPDTDTPKRLRIVDVTSTTVFQCEVETALPPADQGTVITSWGLARRTITGLGRLEGKTVKVLADAGVATAVLADSSLVVTGGNVTIDEPALITVVGLPYLSDLELLDLGGDRTSYKSVSKAGIEVVESRGLWVGETFAKLTERRPRTVLDQFGNPVAETGLVEVTIASTWNQGGRIAIRQVDPLPLTVVGVTRETVPGGKS